MTRKKVHLTKYVRQWKTTYRATLFMSCKRSIISFLHFHILSCCIGMQTRHVVMKYQEQKHFSGLLSNSK